MKSLKNLMYLMIAGSLLVSCGKDEKKADGTADSTQTTQAGADTATYQIDTTASSVKWLGKKVTGQHNGKIKIQSGTIATSGTNVTGGTVTLDMASVTNEDLTDKKYNADLIGHLKSPDFFSTDSFPTATFVFKNVSNGTEGKKNVTGDLTIKGITNEITFPADIKVDSSSLKANGKAVIDRTKWNIRYNSGKYFPKIGDKAIYDEVELEFDVTATK